MELIRNEQRNRFEAIGEYHERFIPKTAKFRWDPQTKIWWTDDVTKAARLADYASDTLATELTGTASEIEKAKDEAIQSSKAVDANIDVPVPEGLEYMPFQKAGIAYGMQRDGVLIADEMGLGKTIQALGIVNASPDAAKVLVICPASLRLNWKKEAEKWLTDDKWNIEIVASKSRPLPNSNFIIINYDILKKFKPYLDTENWDIMIADEVPLHEKS